MKDVNLQGVNPNQHNEALHQMPTTGMESYDDFSHEIKGIPCLQNWHRESLNPEP